MRMLVPIKSRGESDEAIAIILALQNGAKDRKVHMEWVGCDDLMPFVM